MANVSSEAPFTFEAHKPRLYHRLESDSALGSVSRK